MAFPIIGKNGRRGFLLNPHEKGQKYAEELRQKKRMTNDMQLKDKPLTKEGAAYRAGYLDARKDSAKAYNHNQKKKAAKKSSRKKTGSSTVVVQIMF